MLKLANIPNPFQGEAINVAINLINISLSVPLDFNIYKRVLTIKNDSYSHLKVFGCNTFIEQILKLDDKATPYIFVGYGDEKFGYRLWNIEKQKVIKSKDIVFHEHEIVKDMDKNASALELTYEDVADMT